MKNINTIFWDFDGVIMDSNSVRDTGFERVLSEFPKAQVEDLLEFHRKNGGLSRYVKFRYFFEEVRKESVTENQIQVWAAKFSEIMLSSLMNPALLITDSILFIKNNYQKYKMHIVSGSDGNELRKICEEIGIYQYFITIEGSPTPKNLLVKNILETYEYKPENCVLIGDSINDKEAAMSNNVFFRGYNNPTLKDDNYIHSFNQNQ